MVIFKGNYKYRLSVYLKKKITEILGRLLGFFRSKLRNYFYIRIECLGVIG